jgi:dihydrofolate reductase
MGRIVVMNHVTLDGVMQGPGRADEDTSDGFTASGWAGRADDTGEAAGTAMRERMEAGGGLAGWLFGRRTYADLLSYWNAQPDKPFGPMLNSAAKFVASATLTEPLPWPNSTLLRGNVADAVTALKARTQGVLAIMGSGQLIRSLITAGLIDEYLLMIHPLVLGAGRRLFPAGAAVPLRLTSSVATRAGLLIASYETVKAERETDPRANVGK